MQLRADASGRPPRPHPRPVIGGLGPYIQGKSELPGGGEPIKLSSNESSHGPSPRAVAAYHAAAAELHRYPDGAQTELREAIAAAHGLDREHIVCGNGSDELLGLLIRAYVGPGDGLLMSENHFVMCRVHGAMQEADIVLAPEKDYVSDVDALLERINANTRMVVIANPNNPTGTYLPGSELRRLHSGIPADVLLVLDNAYAEYVTRADYTSGLDLVHSHDNVVVTHTFSKIYGLAALRIGWACCPAQVIEVIQRIRSPFNANRAALAAAAAAVQDRAHIENVRDYNHRWLQKISGTLAELGLKIIPSAANFYLISFAGHAGKNAADAARYLEEQAILTRLFADRDGNGLLRITVGLDHENRAVLKALADYMAR